MAKEKEKFEEPKVVDMQGKGITEEELDDESLEGISAGLKPDCDLCFGGG